MARRNRLFSLWRGCVRLERSAPVDRAYSWRQSVVNIPSTHGSADGSAAIGPNTVGNRPTPLTILIGSGRSELLPNS
jgi:hypothetical protein